MIFELYSLKFKVVNRLVCFVVVFFFAIFKHKCGTSGGKVKNIIIYYDASRSVVFNNGDDWLGCFLVILVMLLPYNLEGNDISMLIYRIPKSPKIPNFYKLFEKKEN